jgi:uncharacterized membrane protein
VNKESSTLVLILVTILVLAVALQPIIPANNEQFSQLGILGPSKTIGNYPSNVTARKPMSLYVFVGNNEGRAYYYEVIVKLGGVQTVVSNSTSANAPEIASYYQVIGNNKNWTVPVNLTISHIGQNQRLIFELWAYNSTQSAFSYLGLWDQLWINVTST